MLQPRNEWLRNLLVIFSLFESLCTRAGHSERFGQGFVHSDNDVRYFGEDVPGVAQSFSEEQTFIYEDEQGTIRVLGTPIKFFPPNLNFQDRPIGVPGLHKVTIHNINDHSSIQMLSISGNTIHFHCSFFNDKVIPPGGNTTFDVVFLGREEGHVENTLYIHTSAGSFRYNVEGVGTPNPYRIRPLTGVRLPLNSSYSPIIELYNPHSTTIQVLEMYSSGGDLHLELPMGGLEGDTDTWQIPPYHTKQVMRANFLARTENNHTAYIRIKTNTTDAEFLYLPLEVEVTSQPGLYCPQERLDFGLVSSDGGPRSLELTLLNSGTRPVTITSVVTTPVNEAIVIQSKPVKVLPDTLHTAAVSTITFDPLEAGGDGVKSGKFLVKSDNSKYKVIVPWTATVLQGGLTWNSTVGRFLLTDKPNPEDPSHADIISTSRPLVVTNKFTVPVFVHSVNLASGAEKFFKLLNVFQPTVIPPGESVELVTLSVKKEAWLGDRQLDSYLQLNTNLTTVKVSLITFDGRLKWFFPSTPTEPVLDFGTIGMNEKHDMYFALINKGPVKVVLRGWGGNITGCLVELMGVGPGNETKLLSPQHNHSDLTRQLFVLPGHFVVYRIGLLSGVEEGELYASVFVSTEYEELQVPIRFRVAKGSLSTVPGQLTFDTAFPGKLSQLKLHVHSSFKHKMRVKSLSIIGGDPRFTFDVGDEETPGSSLLPGQKSEVGRVTFDPGANCRVADDCYTGFLPEGNFGHPWYLGLALPLNLAQIDLDIVDKLWSRMRVAAFPTSMFNVTLRLDTNEVRGFLFSARAALSWPVLSSQDSLQFPLTQLGNSSRSELKVTNPSSQPLLVHLVPMSVYPNAETILRKLPNRIKLTVEKDFIEQNKSNSLFTIESIVDADNPFNPLGIFGDGFAEKFGIDISSSTWPIYLKAGQSVKINLAFIPKDSIGLRSSVLFIRNNLTGVEVVDLSGVGAVGDLKFGNRKAGSIIHAFEVTEKHLKDCDKTVTGKQTHTLPNLTVKRPFTARNTGQVPLWVTGFDIDGQQCEGFGFKVLDCEPFLLAANDSKKINIAFTPDFTLSRVTRTLTLHTSLGTKPGLGKVKYSLAATVPSHLLSICSQALPRHSWEFHLYYVIIALLTCSLCCVLIFAFIEANRILKFCFLLASPTQHNFVPENAKLLDLKEVARSVVLESDKRMLQSQHFQDDKKSRSGRQSPTLPLVNELRKSNTVNSLVQDTRPEIGTIEMKDNSNRGTLATYLDPWLVGGKLGGLAWFIYSLLIPCQAIDEDIIVDSATENLVDKEETLSVKAVVAENKNVKSKLDSSTVTTRKTTNKKVTAKLKLCSQNSINTEVEASSTTTEGSYFEDITEPLTKGIKTSNNVGSDSSSSPNMPELSKKKKKPIKRAESNEPLKENKAVVKPKADRRTEKQEIKQELPKESERTKVKAPGVENQKCGGYQTTSHTPDNIHMKPPRQEAKVKGVPQEESGVHELRRQQSAPAYDRQSHQALNSHFHQETAQISYSSHSNQSGFPTQTSSIQKPDPPRAIILPEVKQNQGSQYGPIGSRGHSGGGHIHHKSTWQDSPAAPSMGMGQGLHQQMGQVCPQAGLLPPPGLTIMQQLQAERRQREEDYVRRQSNWPGFGDGGPQLVSGLLGGQSNHYVESLWDSQPGRGSVSPPVHPVTLAGSQGGLWGTIGNVWPSTVINSGFGYSEGQESNERKEEGEHLAFDSLSLSSIWSADGTKEADNGSWSSLFNNNAKKEL